MVTNRNTLSSDVTAPLAPVVFPPSRGVTTGAGEPSSNEGIPVTPLVLSPLFADLALFGCVGRNYSHSRGRYGGSRSPYHYPYHVFMISDNKLSRLATIIIPGN